MRLTALQLEMELCRPSESTPAVPARRTPPRSNAGGAARRTTQRRRHRQRGKVAGLLLACVGIGLTQTDGFEQVTKRIVDQVIVNPTPAVEPTPAPAKKRERWVDAERSKRHAAQR